MRHAGIAHDTRADNHSKCCVFRAGIFVTDVSHAAIQRHFLVTANKAGGPHPGRDHGCARPAKILINLSLTTFAAKRPFFLYGAAAIGPNQSQHPALQN